MQDLRVSTLASSLVLLEDLGPVLSIGPTARLWQHLPLTLGSPTCLAFGKG